MPLLSGDNFPGFRCHCVHLRAFFEGLGVRGVYSRV